ncbi:hypothetical protein BM221_005895 [Beauveria bassiana]|uniref:Uncharacterized protein n=1 Tax=Beauveria bassiana TaxID=176275 RepID=A0A2N6NKE1_BEABA|nr:hypothetical protein BM221_005895 [Beauveria bassiana]
MPAIWWPGSQQRQRAIHSQHSESRRAQLRRQSHQQRPRAHRWQLPHGHGAEVADRRHGLNSVEEQGVERQLLLF